jgi:methyl-CpG-binding domain protein 4
VEDARKRRRRRVRRKAKDCTGEEMGAGIPMLRPEAFAGVSSDRVRDEQRNLELGGGWEEPGQRSLGLSERRARRSSTKLKCDTAVAKEELKHGGERRSKRKEEAETEGEVEVQVQAKEMATDPVVEDNGMQTHEDRKEAKQEQEAKQLIRPRRRKRKGEAEVFKDDRENTTGKAGRQEEEKKPGGKLEVPPDARGGDTRKSKRQKREGASVEGLPTDAGLEEAPTEVQLNLPVANVEITIPLSCRVRTRTKKTGTVSPYFPTPTPSDSSTTDAPKRRRRPPTASPYFAAATASRHTAKGVSCIPWPPRNAPRFGLVQEELAHNPFHLLIATTFLNKTKGSVAKPLIYQFLTIYPTPDVLSQADQQEVTDFLQPLGLQRTRAERLIKMAKTWMLDPPRWGRGKVRYNYPPRETVSFPVPGQLPFGTEVKKEWEVAHLPGAGAYALDSWRLFCRDEMRREAGENVEEGDDEWRRVVPMDKELRAYVRWMWSKEGVVWTESGDVVEMMGEL